MLFKILPHLGFFGTWGRVTIGEFGSRPENTFVRKVFLATVGDMTGFPMISLLDTRLAGLAEQLEMRDTATPVTCVRYTGNWPGSYEGRLVGSGSLRLPISKTLPRRGDSQMAGQWVGP